MARRPGLAYVPALTGLRAFAVAAVVALHAGLPFARGGALGVDVFFVLSGYLITSLLLAEYDRSRRIDYRAFMVRRLRRLAPALLFMLGVVALFALIAPLHLAAEFQYPQLGRSLLAAGTYTMNIDFQHGVAGGPMFHTWSLAVEMQFYLIWPLVLLAALSLGARTRGLIWMTVGLMVVVAGWRLFVQHYGGSAHAAYGLDTQADQLLAGAVVAMLTRNELLPTRALTWLAPVAVIVLGVLFVHALSQPQLAAGGAVVICVCSAVIVAQLASGRRLALFRPLDWAVIVYIGEVSYGIYLWHFPVFHALTAHSLGVSHLPSIIIRLTVTFGLAALSYHTVERWFRAPSRVRTEKADLPPRTDLELVGVGVERP